MVRKGGARQRKEEITIPRYAEFLEPTGQTRPPAYWPELKPGSQGDRPVTGVMRS
jgi:hypothetical protein